jgi:hypothetical protein
MRKKDNEDVKMFTKIQMKGRREKKNGWYRRWER